MRRLGSVSGLDSCIHYDTVWHRGLHLKLLRIIPDRHMVGFIMEMLSNRSFVVHTSDGQRSRLKRMKNGVPQSSVLSPMLFNIYISDLPETTSRKYGYADDLAILLRRPSWKEMEEGLNNDMTILVDYLRPKAEGSHPRLGTESSETRLAHPARHHKERSASMHTQVP